MFGLFLSPAGILILGILDASIVFFLPVAIDMAIVMMSARNEYGFLVFPLLAVAGTVVGAAVTFTIGRKIGDLGLGLWISEARLKRVRSQIGRKGLAAIGTAALIPPPFPLTPFILTGGALGLDRRKFLSVLAAARLARFGAEAGLASVYGESILVVTESEAFGLVISGIMIVAIAGTAITVVQIVRRVR